VTEISKGGNVLDIFTTEELLSLMEHGDDHCVSLFMPTHRKGPEVQQDPIRFRNLLKKAREDLVSQGLRGPEADELLHGPRNLGGDSMFWNHQSDGLAMFISSDRWTHYRVPRSFSEMVFVGDRFVIKPMLPLITGDGRFYLLTLSQNQVQLFQGSKFSLTAVEDMGDVPTSLAEALQWDDPEPQLQSRIGGPGRGGRDAAIFHGHGDASEEAKTDILRYFQLVDRGLSDLLAGDNAPLVLAGVDYLLSIYQEANTYSNLLEDGVTGHPDREMADDLHRKAWEVVEPVFRAEIDATVERYNESAGTGATSDNIREIVPAAAHGRVDTLLVAEGAHIWGQFDPENIRVEVRDEAEPGDEDLLDLASVLTLQNSGVVHAASPEKVPGHDGVIALYRY